MMNHARKDHWHLSVAPMMDWTDRHERFFLRLISKRALLYTEMITTGAILKGDRDRLLAFHPAEHPVALQLGGSDPQALAECARIGADLGYDEINLNVGCPSDRVQTGRFGACLMLEPELVRDGIAAMRESVSIPVTVKHRIGVDDRDSYDDLCRFVSVVAESGCTVFTVHARKAWLSGLSPKQNREIPPLSYETVYRLKRDFPQFTIVLNGGVRALDEAEEELRQVDGVMIGRAAYETPYMLAEADRRIFGEQRPVLSRREIVEAFIPYVRGELAAGTHLRHMTRHILGLFQGLPGARAWRRTLTEGAVKAGAGLEVIQAALKCLPDAALDARDPERDEIKRQIA
jgi:tRNA-dihydrouridine synthase A